MLRWFRRLTQSRRVRAGTLAAIGLLTMGSCGGALLANYTVAGMNTAYLAQYEPPDPVPRRSAADWMAREAFRTVESDSAEAEFADPWVPEPVAATN